MLVFLRNNIFVYWSLGLAIAPGFGCSGANFMGSSGPERRPVAQPGEGLSPTKNPESKDAQVGQNQENQDIDWGQFGSWEEGGSEVDQKGKGLGVSQSEAKAPAQKGGNPMPGSGVCARNWGQTPDGTHITGQGQKQDLTLTGSHSFKITGTGHELNVQLNSDKVVDHLCVFMTGDLNQLRLKLAASVSVIYLVTSGNQPDIGVEVAKDKKVDFIKILMSGSQGKISVGGEGTHRCEVTTKGQNNTANCKT